MTDKNLLKELGAIDPSFIEQADPCRVRCEECAEKKTVPTVKRSVTFPKKLTACVAAFALILCVMSAVGFERVYADLRSLFSFLPGIGIDVAKENDPLYTYESIKGRVETEELRAELVRASFADGSLSATVLVNKGITSEDVALWINGVPYQSNAGAMPSYTLAYSSESSMIEIIVSTPRPQQTDRYEIAVKGLEERLSFSMKPCQTYAELCEIGPTVTKNGITLTVTADRVGNELVVWCYETRTQGATDDRLANIGKPANGSYELRGYLETEQGRIFEKTQGWQLVGRSVYEISGATQTAVLHIPYLAMLREERGEIALELPKGYTAVKTDGTIATSLGTVKLVGMERIPGEGDKDMVRLTLDYESKHENMQLYGLNYHVDDIPAASVFDAASGRLEVIELWVDRETSEARLTFDGIYYYLTDGYRFELEIGD